MGTLLLSFHKQIPREREVWVTRNCVEEPPIKKKSFCSRLCPQPPLSGSPLSPPPSQALNAGLGDRRR